MFLFNCKKNLRIAIFIVCLFGNFLRIVVAFDPFTAAALGTSVVMTAFLAGYDVLKCAMTECCNEKWISFNSTGFEASLERSLHGQHLVRPLVFNLLKHHLQLSTDPGKALVFSFHGWTGGGKNYVSQIIAQHLYRKGMNSQFVHLIPSRIYFKHDSQVNQYKDQLETWIKGNVSICARQLFIFDEVDDNMPSGVMDVLKPFLDYHQHIDKVDYRKAIFIFLSNTGGEIITKRTYDAWEEGRSREDITAKEMEKILMEDVFNQEGGLYHSNLIHHNLISAFVPFLPMERLHVKKCILDKIREMNVTHLIKDVAMFTDKVLNELQFIPEGVELYSTSGCKRIVEKINLILD